MSTAVRYVFRLLLLIASALLVSIAATAAEPAGENLGSVEIRVLDPTGAAVTGAEVLIQQDRNRPR